MTTPLDSTVESRDEAAPRLGMAPLVDIVLLLICFYLLVMRSIDSHVDDTVVLPLVTAEEALDILPAELVVNRDEHGVISLNGATVDIGTLLSLLTIELGRAAEAGRDLRVVIRADARQPYGALDEILEVCKQAGAGSITLRTRLGDG